MEQNIKDVETMKKIAHMIKDDIYEKAKPGTDEAKNLERLAFFILTIFDSIYVYDAPELSVISKETGNNISGKLHNAFQEACGTVKGRYKKGEVAANLGRRLHKKNGKLRMVRGY